MAMAGLPSRTSRWTRLTPSARAASKKLVSSLRADAAAVMLGMHRNQQQLALVGDGADQREADSASPLSRSQASTSETPAMGRIPLSCERVQASPKRSPKAVPITVITASRSSDDARFDAHGRRSIVAITPLPGARIGRAGVDRLGARLRRASGSRRASAAAGQLRALRPSRAHRPAAGARAKDQRSGR